MTFKGYEKEKKERSDIVFDIPVSKEIVKNIGIHFKILTPFERDIISILNAFSPLNTKEVRDEYIRYQSSRFYSDSKESLEKLVSKYIKDLEAKLKSEAIKIPSYHTFDNILLSLEKLGIVGRRYDSLKRGKWLWILNPNYLSILQKNKIKIQEPKYKDFV